MRMPRYANLIWVDVRPPNLVLKEMSDVQADVTRSLPEPVAYVQCARIKRIGTIVVHHGDDIAARRQVFAEPSIA